MDSIVSAAIYGTHKLAKADKQAQYKNKPITFESFESNKDSPSVKQTREFLRQEIKNICDAY